MPRGYQPFGLPAFPSPLKEGVPCGVFYGNVLTDSGIPHIENGTINGIAQFPPEP
jgi:hypothetical protein